MIHTQYYTCKHSGLVWNLIWAVFILNLAGTTEEVVAVCECDRRVVADLSQSIPNNFALNYPANQCQKAHIPTHTECCKHSNGLYDMINPMVYCCGNTGPKPAGTCGGNGRIGGEL